MKLRGCQKMKIKALLYCTKTKPYLYGMYSGFESRYGYHLTNDKNVYNQHSVLNGKIVAECDYEVEKINIIDGAFTTHTLNEKELLNKSCLTFHQMFDYFADTFNYGYAIHIKNLHIFDEPKELNEYYGLIPKKVNTLNGGCYINESIDNAPQNMMYAIDDNDNEYILISIRPEWLCKILNGEKTIEIRKKILKEMLKNE